ncbi:MAG TPA: flagellar basal-body MS-ring/collar protein FliF [Candidatus Kapabacteria bacterium]|nr:flagellar basal-body MS-ring/collar protein FliF [Candidatus Kapabacteria bacterium]
MAKLELIGQGKQFLSKLTNFQKILLFGSFVIVLTGILLFVVFSSQNKEMAVLFTGLNEGEAAKIVESLKEKAIEYELKDNGTTILVDKKTIYDTRLSLASEGLPESGTIGYELFDKTNLGMSEFVQKLNYRRALEGELARTITSLDEVKNARVHIVIPEKSLFEKDQKPTTASVTLHLKNGRSLSKINVEGIQNLIANSVEGMQSSSVSIIDQKGKVLSDPPADMSSISGLTSTQHEQQMNVEQYVANKVQSLLDGVYGAGNTEVRVNAELDFTQIEKTITEFDPERQAVLSEQSINEVSRSTDSLSYPAVNMARDQSNQISNYEVSKTVERIVEEVGNVKRLTVAVLVNSSQKIVEKDGKKVLENVPRTEEEINKLTEIVKNAVGFNPMRDDQITVDYIPFETPLYEEDLKMYEVIPWWKEPENIKLFVLILAILFTIILMIKILSSKQIKNKLRLALALPEEIKIDEEEIKEEEKEEIEEIEFDDEELMLLPTDLPDHLLLEGEKPSIEISNFGDDDEELLDRDALAKKARAKLDERENVEITEETLMKLEIKDKVADYVTDQTQEAIRLIRILMGQDFEEKNFKF